MGRLAKVPARVTMAPARLASMRSGDERIRGNSLQVIRRRILARDLGLCQCSTCKARGYVLPATIVDHVVPLWAGGREHDSNRSAISEECHKRKNAHEAACRARGVWEPESVEPASAGRVDPGTTP